MKKLLRRALKNAAGAKARRDLNQSLNRCINNPINTLPHRQRAQHGPVYRGGRCFECWTKKTKKKGEP